ncbi:MAG: nitrous oxide reductase family maturation protein NosD, partial [Promethearchaeota archaeon]
CVNSKLMINCENNNLNKYNEKIQVQLTNPPIEAKNNEIVYGTICIDSNNALDAFCAGKSTDGLSWDTAHVISDYDIDAEGYSRHAIVIQNTDRYLIIRDCEIKNAEIGLYFEDVSNVKIIDNTISKNDNGIFLRDCNDNEILENDINENDLFGIVLHDCNDNEISENTIKENDDGGIYLKDCSDNEISENTIKENGREGIYLDFDSNENEISENTVQKNGLNGGIHLRDSNLNTILGNTIENNEGHGIYLHKSKKKCDRNLISENVLNENKNYGIYLRMSNHNKVLKNILNYNKIGIVEEDCQGNTFKDNICTPDDQVMMISIIIFLIVIPSILGILIVYIVYIKKNYSSRSEK